MSNCSNHRKDLFGQTDMQHVAEDIGNLHYEALANLFNSLAIKFSNDSKKDMAAGRKELAECLMRLSDHIEDALFETTKAYKISKPFMEDLPTQGKE